jgi:uncharacterized Rossmann fold enzyme
MQATSEAILLNNIEHLVPRQPALARAILEAQPATLDWLETPEGPSALYQGRALASRRTPMTEARQWADRASVADHSAIICTGFSLGLHLLALAERQTPGDTIFVLETDIPLLRAVLERIDLTNLLSRSIYIITDPADTGTLAGAMARHNRSVALGVHIADFVPSLPRLSQARATFLRAVNGVVSSTRTIASSELLQTECTFRNLLHNLDYYTTRPGIAPWANILKGRPAVVVAAGPSLARTIDQLARPGVRQRVLIVAAQTVLKPLLARGIRPHIVCALDHHQISARFYEGLTPQDLQGVTLVIEPKVNPAVPVAFPGNVRVASDILLDTLLGTDLIRPLGSIAGGSTVAHLAYYLARYLGCDPVALTGMDLGFTDGQYYSSGAAIHSVWAGELSTLNTLEMLEWQRVKRMGWILRKATDILDRPIYTDEQMHTYLQHFLAVFKEDADRGLTTLDATEGGVRKENAQPRKLQDLIDTWLTPTPGQRDIDDLLTTTTDPSTPAAPHKRLDAVRQRLAHTRQGLFTIKQMSTQAEALLIEAREHQQDHQRVERLVHQLDKMRKRITTIDPAWQLLNIYNSIGSFKRWRADRALRLDEKNLTEYDIQRRQAERDIVNVQWLAEAATRFANQLDAATATLNGAPRITSDQSHAEEPENATPKPTLTCRAIIPVLLQRNGLGLPRDLSAINIAGTNVLTLTINRLLRINPTLPITLVTDRPDAVATILGPLARNPRIDIHTLPNHPDAWSPTVLQAARAFTRSAYRGGLANLTCYDEALDANVIHSVLESTNADAALICGCDWPLLDPSIAAALIDRFNEHANLGNLPHALFTQAVPGLAPALIPRATAKMLAAARSAAGIQAGLSGLTGYRPSVPMVDPIAHAGCVQIDPAVRDGLLRCIADTPQQADWLTAALTAAGLDAHNATATQTALAIRAHALNNHHAHPWHLRLNLGQPGNWLDEHLAHSAIARTIATRPDAAITIEGDTLNHPAWHTIARAASAVAPLHLRCGPLTHPEQIDLLRSANPAIISIDLISLSPQTFASLRPDLLAGLGPDAHAKTQRLFESLVNGLPMDPAAQVRTPWVVPRLVRCDATYADIDTFFDNTMHTLSWAIIEPLDRPAPADRIQPLAIPTLAQQRASVEEIHIAPGLQHEAHP